MRWSFAVAGLAAAAGCRRPPAAALDEAPDGALHEAPDAGQPACPPGEMAVLDEAPCGSLIEVGHAVVPGVETNGPSALADLSPEGRFVTFDSDASNLVPDDRNPYTDVFRRDLETGETARVSVAWDGGDADGDSTLSSVSEGGRVVVFWSTATNLVADDANGGWDVFARDLEAGATVRVNLRPDGGESETATGLPTALPVAPPQAVVSADGRRVAFVSSAPDLTAGDASTDWDVFVRDLATGVTVLASVPPGGEEQDFEGRDPSISADGRFVAFNERWEQVFVRDVEMGTTTLASVAWDGGKPDGYSAHPSLSADGRLVAFWTSATNLVAGDASSAGGAVVRDLVDGITWMVDTGSFFIPFLSFPSLSPDGSAVVMWAGETADPFATALWRFTLATGDADLVQVGADGSIDDCVAFGCLVSYGDPGVSADGTRVAFHSAGANLAPPDRNEGDDVFVRDLASETTTRVSVPTPGACAPDGAWYGWQSGSVESTALADAHVAFASTATNLAAGDDNGVADMFVADLAGGGVVRLDAVPGDSPPHAFARVAGLTPDGRFVAWAVSAWPLDDRVDDAGYVHDFETGETLRVEGYVTAVSADGRTLALLSRDPDLVPGDTNELADVFVVDLVSGVTERIMAWDGAEPDGWPSIPDTSADGRYVAFSSDAANLVPGDTNDAADVFLFDRVEGTLTRESVRPDGSESAGGSYLRQVALSADGGCLAFSSGALDLVDDDANGVQHIFVRDLGAGVTVRASVGAAGEEGDGWSYGARLSADGRMVVFSSKATNLVPGDTNGVADIFVRDLERGETRRVSVGPGGEEPNAGCSLPALSPDGRRFAFVSAATTLLPGSAPPATRLFAGTLCP